MGRPSEYTDEIAAVICERLSCGDSLRKMCRDDDSLPHESTVYRWLSRDAAFCERYACARQFQTESHLEDIFEIADDDDIKPDDKRVRIDARKWAMSKLAAKKYGDKTILSNDPDNPVTEVAKPLDIARRVAFLLTKAEKTTK